MHQHFHISCPQAQQRPGCLKSMTRTRSAPPPAHPPPYHLQNLPTTLIHPATPSCNATCRQRSFNPGSTGRNAAAGAPGSDDSLICDEDYHGPPSPGANLHQQQQQRQAAVQLDNGEHGRGWSCC
ncbi:uncharacterized protein F5147DRAFT_834854 [Suillus discolor]|uniref:Uncharacterized protein n=1 Tax=Suillus discolor TaxID=1912936 RepID=A0A9P7FE99_9AGAM|nr:uncharacterized protein F5147DRAFT_834854 [Suillus discolor]KAG2113896.1 hypothetical protein F5147DRAFT_834854 [Suillus discolor]